MSQRSIAETERDINLIDKIKRDNMVYKNSIQLVEGTLPSNYFEVAFFSSEIERLARENTLDLKINIDQKTKEEKASYNSAVYSLETNGSYSAVTNFLTQMAKLPYHTSIDYLKITKEEGKTISNIKFRLFIQK